MSLGGVLSRAAASGAVALGVVATLAVAPARPPIEIPRLVDVTAGPESCSSTSPASRT